MAECNYPECNCPFDMGPEHKCLRGLELPLSEPKADSTVLLRGEEYNFKHKPDDRLIYIGKKHIWHQFERIGSRGVWCELLDSDLYLIEKRTAA